MASSIDAQARSNERSLRLDSWKEIAAYLKKGERTVRRWERAEGLPVHRHVHEKAASVFAYSGELDAWVQTRGTKNQVDAATSAPGPLTLRSRVKILAFVLSVLITGGVLTVVLLPRPFGDLENVAVPLTTYPGDELDPSFSPDGSQVVFSWNGPSQDNFDIYVKTIGQENYVRVTRNPEVDFNPVWSPDGRFIAFLRELDEEQAAVMLVSSLGGPEVTLAKFRYPHVPGLRTSFPVRFLCWHPSGKYLVAAVSESGPFALHTISLSGEVRSVTTPDITAGLGDLNPTFAPNGKTVAFIRYLSPGFGGQICTVAVSPDGKAVKPQTVSWAASNAISLVWTHDGRQLVYQRYGERTLWSTSGFGRNTPRRLTIDTADIRNPATSRDARSLVFSTGRTDLDVARSEISPLLTETRIERVISSTRVDTEPRLSLDGRRIVFASERSGRREIWISGVDGSAARQVTTPSNAINEQPSWSPDGRKIVFDSRLNGGNGRIYIAQADQPGIHPVTNGSADDSTPRWSRDGKWLYFSSNRTGRSEIWKASTSNLGDQRQVTIHGGDGPIESPDGVYLYYVHRSALSGPQRLRRVKISTGEEQSLLDSRNINWWDFVPGNDGVYFADIAETNSAKFLYFYELGTGQIRRVASLPKSYYCCLDVSNDQQHVYYSVLDTLGHDLLMVPNFH
jgi:Tol biopolymer transport system component